MLKTSKTSEENLCLIRNEATFGERLRKLRKINGLTTCEVASLCKVAESTYREWEYGREIRGIRPYSILAKTFRVSLPELMVGESGMSSSIEEELRCIEEAVKAIRLKLG